MPWITRGSYAVIEVGVLPSWECLIPGRFRLGVAFLLELHFFLFARVFFLLASTKKNNLGSFAKSGSVSERKVLSFSEKSHISKLPNFLLIIIFTSFIPGIIYSMIWFNQLVNHKTIISDNLNVIKLLAVENN